MRLREYFVYYFVLVTVVFSLITSFVFEDKVWPNVVATGAMIVIGVLMIILILKRNRNSGK